MPTREGVVKFIAEMAGKVAPSAKDIDVLNVWRSRLREKGLIGRDLKRYNGAGYGNVSMRVPPFTALPGKRRFIITGTQTGGLAELEPRHYSTVIEYNPEQNKVVADGEIAPSSEALTHGAVYDCDGSIRFVFHVHSPEIWANAARLHVPTTRKDVAYGTPEMAEEVMRLFREADISERRIFAMGGHEDGIITFGRTADEAGKAMLEYLAKCMK